MYPPKRIFTALGLMLVIFLVSCSSSDSPLSPQKGDIDSDSVPVIGLTQTDDAFSATGLLGAFEMIIDTENMTVDLVPKRNVSIGQSYIVSGIGFFTVVPCSNCLYLNSLRMDHGDLVLNFGIDHPFEPGNIAEPPTGRNRLDLDVFDLALLIAPGEREAMEFTELGISAYTGLVANASGYTREMADVTGDDSAIPYVLVIDDSIIGISTWNKFMMGSHMDFDVSLSIEKNESLAFNMYLTMGYGASAVKATRLEPTYYNPEFNRKAAWKVNVIPPQGDESPMMGNTWADNHPEMPFMVKVEVFDWQIGATVNSELTDPKDIFAASGVANVTVDIPGLGSGSVLGSAHDGLGTGMPDSPLVYHVPIMNEGLIPAGIYTGMAKVTDERIPAITLPPIQDRDFLIDAPDGVTMTNYLMPEYATYQEFEATVVRGVPGIIIQQMDYSCNGEAPIINSSFGNVRVNYEGLPSPQFFNLNVEGEWVIQNVPLLPIQGFGVFNSVNISFDLGVPSGTPLTVLNAGWSIDPGFRPVPPPLMGPIYVWDGYGRNWFGRWPSEYG